MKCPKCGEKMVDKGYTGMMYFECECGHEMKMSIDEYWQWLKEQHRLYGNPQIPTQDTREQP